MASNDPLSFFVGYANELGLDANKFQQDFASATVNNSINADKKAGQDLKITATPTFFLDGKKIDSDPKSVDDFSKLIDQEIATKK